MATPTDDRLTTIFAALAHPARRAILATLTGGPSTTARLAPHLDLSVRTVRRHVSVLVEAGLIVRERVGQRRLLRLAPLPMEDAASWLAGYRTFWEGVHARSARRSPGVLGSWGDDGGGDLAAQGDDDGDASPSAAP